MRLGCRIAGHNWDHTLSVGDAKEYQCTRRNCGVRKVIVSGVTLEPEDAAQMSEEMWKSARAVMWILDNVEPSYTSDGTGTEQR